MQDEYTQKLAKHMATQAEALLNQHLDSAVEAAQDSEAEKAEVTLKLKWPHGSPAPNVRASISYTTSHKDEAESVFDPEQTKLDGIDE